MIRISYEVKEMIEEEKIIPREPLNDCIKRGILENRKNRLHPSIETKESLKKELESVVTNPNARSLGSPDNEHIDIWKNAHPGEQLLSGEHIHHINGNHNDNRIENLEKVTVKEHGEAHTQLRKEFLPLYSTKSNDIIGKNI